MNASRFHFLFVIAALLALAGCSSGSRDSPSGEGQNNPADIPPNIPPVAGDVCENTPFNTTLMGDLSSTVTDPDSPVLHFSLASQASKGVATVDVTGTYTYTPFATTAAETDSFTYTVDDLDGDQATATVTIIIIPRIMLLGDSITAGTGEPATDQRVGYRQKLFEDLVTDGYVIDFVGGRQEPAPASFDSDHEGHPGFTAGEVASGVFAWLTSNPADIILLHIGTNGFTTTTNGVVQILDQIDSWEASNNNPITLFLAQIINRDPFQSVDVITFNQNLAALVQNRSADNIILVNQHDALDYPGDLFDRLHPTQTGYQKMADRWFAALTEPVTGPLTRCPQ